VLASFLRLKLKVCWWHKYAQVTDVKTSVCLSSRRRGNIEVLFVASHDFLA
jgi:hypothetical protein